jgi:hypothetical protein
MGANLTLFRFAILIVLLMAAFITALPVAAAPGGTILSYNLNAAGCYVDITVQVQDAGFYAVNMWDDGNFRAGAGQNVPENAIFTVRFSIGGVILQGSPGIGIYLEDGVGPAAVNTYDADGSAQLWDDGVGTACALTTTWGAVAFPPNGGACIYPLPEGSAVYNVPAGALAFFDDNPDTYAGFNLPPGTWYISEFGEDFAKVWIACGAQPIYIPVDNVIR